jgi:hypothetical protein
MKAYGRGRGSAALILHCEHWKEKRSYLSIPASLLPLKKSGTHWVWNRMGHRAGKTFGGEKNSLPPTGIRVPDRPARNLVPTPTALRRHSDWPIVLLYISNIHALIFFIPSILMISLVNTTFKQDTADFSSFCATGHYYSSSPLAFLHPGDKLTLVPPTIGAWGSVVVKALRY